MPLVPESRRSRQDVKASISSQFWEQPVHSTKSVDGQLWSLPCEPPALNLTGSSGLSRTQQLLAAQAVRVPLFPSYDGSSNGLVLDRVIAKAGGRRWWTALSGRVKAQRAYNLAAGDQVSKVDAVRDLGNYALCARGRFQLGRRLTLNMVVEAPDARKLQQRLADRLQQHREALAVVAAASAAAAAAMDGAAAGEAGAEAGAADGISADAVPAPAADHSNASLGTSSSGGGNSCGAGGVPELEPCRAHVTLRCALPGHDLSTTAGYNLQYMDSTGDVSHVPLAVSLDLASHDRQDGLQYRVGLHQVTAPLTEVPPKPGAVQRWRTSLHAQGALAVEGEAYIWKAAGSSSSSVSTSLLPAEGGGVGALKQQGKGGGGGSEEEAGGEEPRYTKLANALEKAAAADEVTALLRNKSGGRSQREKAEGSAGSAVEPSQVPEPAAVAGAEVSEAGSSRPAAMGSEQQQVAAWAAGSQVQAAQQAHAAGRGEAAPQAAVAEGVGGEAGRRQPRIEDFMRPLEQLGGQVSDMLHSVTHPKLHQPDTGSGAGSSSTDRQPGASRTGNSGGGGGGPGSGPLLGLSSHSITATIQESVALLQQVRESVERLTSNVQDGSLQRLSQQLADSRGTPQRRRPYSMLLAQPHLKLNAALGCLARMPLPPLRAFTFPHASLEPLEPGGGSGGGSLHTRHASTSSLVSRASYSSQLAETWQPYLKGTALRVFASAAVSGQLGRFTRPWLDFTATSARVDVGLTSPHVVGVVPDPSTLSADSSHRPDKHRAFALEGRGAWHALSVSVAQQVYGPLRARMDARFALDPTSVPASEGERSTLKGVLQTALSVRPSLLDTVYGFDCVLPGTEGAARLAVWFSPKRRECMAELRLF